MSIKRHLIVLGSVMVGYLLVACQYQLATNSPSATSSENTGFASVNTHHGLPITNSLSEPVLPSIDFSGVLAPVSDEWGQRFQQFLDINGRLAGGVSPNGEWAFAVIAHSNNPLSITLRAMTLIDPPQVLDYYIRDNKADPYMENFQSWSPDNTAVLLRSNDGFSCLKGLVIYNLDVMQQELHRTKLEPSKGDVNCNLVEVEWSPDGSRIAVYSPIESTIFIMDKRGNTLDTISIKLNGKDLVELRWTPNGLFFTLRGSLSTELHQIQFDPVLQENIVLIRPNHFLFVNTAPTRPHRILFWENPGNLARFIIYDLETQKTEGLIPNCYYSYDKANISEDSLFIAMSCDSGTMVFNWQTGKLISYGVFANWGWVTNLQGFLMVHQTDKGWILGIAKP